MRPWDKQKKESYEQFEAFTLYRDSSDMRDLKSLAELMTKNFKLLQSWSEKYDWKSRAEDFDKTVNQHQTNSLDKQIGTLGEKQAKQIIEVADSLDDLSIAIKEKLILHSNKIDEKKLEQLLRLISSYMKSMTEIQKIFQILRTIPFNFDQKEEKYPFEKIIQNDEEAFDLARKLLKRINDIRSKKNN